MRIRFYRRINYTYGGNWNEEAVDHCVILMSNVFVMLPHPHPHQHHSNDSRCSHWPYTTILSERFLSARRSQAAWSSASGRSGTSHSIVRLYCQRSSAIQAESNSCVEKPPNAFELTWSLWSPATITSACQLTDHRPTVITALHKYFSRRFL